MSFPKFISENHRSNRINWLRAAVLGANDGIISTASLIVGIAAAQTTQHNILIAGIAALVAGAMSMAAGEYVSVSSQLDIELADLKRERIELLNNPIYELEELAEIYVSRGLQPNLAKEVAAQLMAHDALGAHARDELGITEVIKARPIQAAITSAITFSVGAALPLLMVIIIPLRILIPAISGVSLLFLALLGGLAAFTGGANIWIGAIRVTVWGALALGLTAGIGKLFGAIV
jgi:vacuolar iron transporter family protein